MGRQLFPNSERPAGAKWRQRARSATQNSRFTPPDLWTTTKRGFTLIELLVVIAVIAILAALLLPALARAKYNAKLVLCFNTQHQLSIAATTYAGDNDEYWPNRTGLYQFGQPFALYSDVIGFDDRPMFSDYLGNALHCAFTNPVDRYTNSTANYAQLSYNYWFGWKLGPDERTMQRVGDKLTFQGETYDILVSDWDLLYLNQWTFTSHPDRAGLLKRWDQVTPTARSLWLMNSSNRAPLDLNYARTDGSVFTSRNVTVDDGRINRVAYKYIHQNINTRWTQLPTGL